MTEPNFAPLPRSFVPPLPTQRVRHRGYEYWVEGFNSPESCEGGYRYQVQKQGSEQTPATCHEPFDMATKASFAARESIDRLLGVLEKQPPAPAETEAPPPAKAKRKPRKPKAEKTIEKTIDPDDIDF